MHLFERDETMRILFCNIAWMEYYKGIVPRKDEPKGGGSYVNINNDAHEKYNFDPVYLSKEAGYPEGEYCLGFVETKSTNGRTSNQLNLEKIDGCGAYKDKTELDDVLVVYCALYPDAIEKETYVVGWYKHATIYRNYEVIRFPSEIEGEYYDQAYNAIAKKEDCVLLPRHLRRRANKWRVPRKTKGVAFGFGQASVWFAQGSIDNRHLKEFLDKIVCQIDEYDGENWVDKQPNTNE